MSDAADSALVTRELAAIDRGDENAAERLMPVVYDELRRLASRYLRREAADPPSSRRSSFTRRSCACRRARRST